eukprot:2130370-Pleurochrysis_carterae.AAC.1
MRVHSATLTISVCVCVFAQLFTHRAIFEADSKDSEEEEEEAEEARARERGVGVEWEGRRESWREWELERVGEIEGGGAESC